MTISETPTDYLLFRANCGLQWNNESYVIVSNNEDFLHMLSTAKMRLLLFFDKVPGFINFTLDYRPAYLGYAPSSQNLNIDNYTSWPESRSWVFINTSTEELDDLIDIPQRSEQTRLKIYNQCSFQLCGVLDIGAAFRTMETNISEILTECAHTKISYLSK